MADGLNGHTKQKKRGATRHCCYGLCNSDSRYQEKEHMHGVRWIVFPKPHIDYEKSLRWTRACGRENFTPAKITKWTYMCSKHFISGDEPTNDHPDSIPAMFTPDQVSKMSRKRKPPTPRTNPVSKKLIMEASDALLSLGQDLPPPEVPSNLAFDCPLLQTTDSKQSESETSDKGTSTDKDTENEEKQTQTNYVCSEVLTSKINNIMSKNSLKQKVTGEKTKVSFQDSFCWENVSKDEKKLHFYTGLTVLQFLHLFSCFGSEPETLNYWKGSKTSDSVTRNQEKKISAKDQLFLTLIKLRQAFPTRIWPTDLA